MNIEFNLGFGKDPDGSRETRTVNIAIVGNLSGMARNGEHQDGSTSIRNMFNFDPLEIDAALQRIAPAITLQLGDNAMEMTFANLDDFHPDALFRSQPAFVTISELKQSLADPGKAKAATAVCRELLGLDAPAPAVATPEIEAEPEAESSDDMFSRLLGRSASLSTPGNPAARAAVDRILAEATTEAELAPRTDAGVQALNKKLDGWCASAMREVLRTREFQSLEATWRSIRWFGERLDPDSPLSLWLVDTGSSTPAAWAQDLRSRIVQTAGSVDLLIVLDQFSDTPESLQQLQLLSEMAVDLETRLISAASATLAGLVTSTASPVALDGTDIGGEESEQWKALRSHASATRAALGFPRFLLRQPYGKRSDPVDSFEFEELEPAPDHEAFLWGHPAMPLALMLLQQELRVEDLPMAVYEDGAGQAIMPPSEVYLTDSASEKLLQRGIIPLVGDRGQTDIRVPRLQSIADPPTAF